MKLNTPAGVPTWVAALVREIERAFNRFESPTAPVFVPIFQPSDLPDPIRWRGGMILISGQGLAASNGTAWINVQNGASF